MSDLQSKPGTTSSEQRRHSFTEFRETVSLLSRAPCHEVLTRSPAETYRRFRQTPVPEGQEVTGWVCDPPSVFNSRDPDYLYRPPPKRPFIPSLEQLRLSRKAEGEAIDRHLRQKKPPLPSHLPPQDEAYVQAILTKRGAISKAGREQVADKDIARLRPHQWLNDEIINFYGQLILSRSESQKENSAAAPAEVHINGLVNGIKGKGKAEAAERKPLDVHYFSTFFWPKLTGDGYEKGRLAKWTKKVRAFNMDPLACMLLNFYFRTSLICFRRM